MIETDLDKKLIIIMAQLKTINKKLDTLIKDKTNV
jgi:hypothetical protein